MTLGKNIRVRRQEALLSQEELGLKVGVTQEMICKIERGTKLPSLPLGIAIAEVLGCTVDELVKGVGKDAKRKIASPSASRAD